MAPDRSDPVVSQAGRQRGGMSRRKILAAVLLSLLPGVAGILCASLPLTETLLERTALDILFRLRGELDRPEGVRVVAVDDDSYRELGVPSGYPWPRTLHARLIDTLARAGAAAIVFDVLFIGGDTGGPADRELEGAIGAAGNVVLGKETETVIDRRFRQTRVKRPYGPFASAAAAVGETASIPPERDEVLRTTWLVVDGEPSLALAGYEVATGKGVFRSETSSRLIDYYGPAGTIRTDSYFQALDPEKYLPPGHYDGKIVFVGLSQSAAAGPAPKDAFLTPFRGPTETRTYGVEIHATIAANLLEGRRIDLLPAPLEWLLLLLLPLMASLVFMYLRPLLGGVAFFLLCALPVVSGHVAFTYASLAIPVMIPLVVQLPGAYVVSLIWYYVTTVRERERIRTAFSFYLAPEMIERIVDEPEVLDLGGEEITGTALFTDVQGFTSIAESMNPPDTAAMLNDYFSEITGFVFAEQGTLIKYIGDAVFAIWGAPVRQDDHAVRACAGAVAMVRWQEGPGFRSRAGNGKGLVTRIGVHTGDMLVGNLGSRQRFDYTAIGDAVNLAARLEGLNKHFGTRALASRATIDLTGDRFVVRRLGLVRVVGKRKPVEICELLGRKGDAVALDEAARGRFERALAAFTERRFGEAAEGFRTIAGMCGGQDGPSALYLKLIEGYTRNPPPEDWDGTVVMLSK